MTDRRLLSVLLLLTVPTAACDDAGPPAEDAFVADGGPPDMTADVGPSVDLGRPTDGGDGFDGGSPMDGGDEDGGEADGGTMEGGEEIVGVGMACGLDEHPYATDVATYAGRRYVATGNGVRGTGLVSFDLGWGGLRQELHGVDVQQVHATSFGVFALVDSGSGRELWTLSGTWGPVPSAPAPTAAALYGTDHLYFGVASTGILRYDGTSFSSDIYPATVTPGTRFDAYDGTAATAQDSLLYVDDGSGWASHDASVLAVSSATGDPVPDTFHILDFSVSRSNEVFFRYSYMLDDGMFRGGRAVFDGTTVTPSSVPCATVRHLAGGWAAVCSGDTAHVSIDGVIWTEISAVAEFARVFADGDQVYAIVPRHERVGRPGQLLEIRTTGALPTWSQRVPWRILPSSPIPGAADADADAYGVAVDQTGGELVKLVDGRWERTGVAGPPSDGHWFGQVAYFLPRDGADHQSVHRWEGGVVTVEPALDRFGTEFAYPWLTSSDDELYVTHRTGLSTATVHLRDGAGWMLQGPPPGVGCGRAGAVQLAGAAGLFFTGCSASAPGSPSHMYYLDPTVTVWTSAGDLGAAGRIGTTSPDAILVNATGVRRAYDGTGFRVVTFDWTTGPGVVFGPDYDRLVATRAGGLDWRTSAGAVRSVEDPRISALSEAAVDDDVVVLHSRTGDGVRTFTCWPR